MSDISKYKDRRGEYICYGDILRCVDSDFQNMFKGADSDLIKEPFFMLTKLDNKTMMYVSGMDEYLEEINEFKLKTDKIDELNGFEIFAHRCIYEGVNNAR